MSTDQQDQDFSLDLQQYWLVLKRRWLTTSVVFVSVLGLTCLYTYLQKPIYESQAKLLFPKKAISSPFGALSGALGDLGGFSSLGSPIETEAEVMRSYPIAMKVIRTLDLRDKDGEQLDFEKFSKNLNLRNIKSTDILQVSYKSVDPQEAASVVNTLTKIYLETGVENNRSEKTSTRKFLFQQLPSVEKQVTEAERNLRRFKEENKLVDLVVESKINLESLGKLNDSLTQSQSQLMSLESRSEALKSQLKLNTQQAVDLTALSQSSGVQSILKEYQDVQRDLAVALTTYSKEHPTVIGLTLKEQALKKQLEARAFQTIGSSNTLPLQIGGLQQSLTADLVRAEVERLALGSQVDELQKVYIENKKRLESLPKLEQKQMQLQRQLMVAQGTYQELLKQFQVAQVLEKQDIDNARVVAEALVPERPISPVVLLNLTIGGFLGIILGMGTSLVLESVDKSVKNIEQAKRLLDVPLVGCIPLIGNDNIANGIRQDLPLLNTLYSPISSSFDMLQSNLKFEGSEHKLRTILVASASMGEGKSFVAANLASAVALSGERVLLIDADLHRPSQHQIWEVPNHLGIKNILVGQTNLHNAVHKVSQEPYLDVLSSGEISPNPVRMLSSQRMHDLIEEARKDYDLVIIDAPPMTAVADALTLAKLVDGVLLVVRLGQADSEAVKISKSLLDQAKIPVLGMLANGVTEENSYGGYYYKSDYYKEKSALPASRY